MGSNDMATRQETLIWRNEQTSKSEIHLAMLNMFYLTGTYNSVDAMMKKWQYALNERVEC